MNKREAQSLQDTTRLMGAAIQVTQEHAVRWREQAMMCARLLKKLADGGHVPDDQLDRTEQLVAYIERHRIEEVAE